VPEQLPVINKLYNVTTAETPSTSLISRGLSAIQSKETDIARTKQDVQYRQARDIYNRITDYGWETRFSRKTNPKYSAQLELFENNQLQPFYAMRQQLADVSSVFQQLADQGYSKANFPLARMYRGGQGISINIEKFSYYTLLAFDWCFSNQGLNNPEIMNDLGCMYQCGQGVEQDYKQAEFWCRQAAELGHARAQCNLGLMYQLGRGIEQDDHHAVFWYCKAAEQGDAVAQCHLGWMHQYARGVSPYTDTVAVKRTTGKILIEFGVVQDIEQSVFWYLEAAEKGDAVAQFNLGVMYDNGFGVVQDYGQAVFWYRKAAEQGDADAQCSLGFKYNSGRGIAHDNEKSVFWYQKANEQGVKSSQKKHLTKHRNQPERSLILTEKQEINHPESKLAKLEKFQD